MAENNISGFIVDVQYIHSPYFIIASLGTTSNVLLLIAFVKDPLKCFRNSATYLVMNLSVSDTLACIFLPIATLIIPGFTTAFHCFLPGSRLTMTSISFDRYFVVAYPLKYRVLFTRKVTVVWLTCIWLASPIAPILQLFYGSEINEMFILDCFGSLVVLVLSTVNLSTYLKLKKHSKNIALQNSTESRAQEIRTLQQKRFLKTFLLTECIAIICIVPFGICYQLSAFCNLCKASEIVELISIFMFHINFAVNPLIYVTCLPKYRRSLHCVYFKRGS